MDNYVGKRLDGRYEVQEIIGVGGMSVVYKAYDNVDDRIVAVKVLKDEFSNNDEFKRRFKNESKAIALLSHPNIVRVYDVNFGEKLQYIVMEYIDGITLKEYINKQGAITWNDAIFFMTQILHAIQHAHDKGIVHRDIKPQNIILLSNGDIKVTDFGIARFSRSETKTLTEQAIGSVHYIAPEQAKGEYTDEKADIYSLGVVLYEMLSGDVPFEAESAVSVALMQLQADAKRLTDINPDIPLGLEQICIRAMQKNPADRYQTATEMLLDIEEINRNPNTTFNYTALSSNDNNPTKIISKGDVIRPVEQPPAAPEEDDEVYEDPDRKKKIISAVIIGIIILAAAVVLLVMAITNGMQKNSYIVDNYVGMRWDDVKIAADKGDYHFQFIADYEKTDKEEPGIILSQNPQEGTKLQEGSQVKLVVAAAQDGLTVPQVFGYTESQAKSALAKAGFVNIKTATESSETVESGKVTHTEPTVNTVVDSTEEITIFISIGPSTSVVESIEVPDVYGLSQSGARAFLEKLGFTNVSFRTQDSTVAKDTVIDQSPSAGSTALATDSIVLIISSGVTTTTTEKQIKTSIIIKLPEVIDKNGNYVKDKLTISVGGTPNTTKVVTLDGSNYSPQFVTSKEGEEIEIVVSLNDTAVMETQTNDGNADKTLRFDFSGSSRNDSEQTTEDTSGNPDDNENPDE